MGKTFEMKDLREAQVCPGLEIARDRHKEVLHLSQKHYVVKLLSRFGMTD